MFIAIVEINHKKEVIVISSKSKVVILESEFPMQGEFNSLTWNPENATGIVLYSANTVVATDLVPELGLIWVIGFIFLIEVLKY